MDHATGMQHVQCQLRNDRHSKGNAGQVKLDLVTVLGWTREQTVFGQQIEPKKAKIRTTSYLIQLNNISIKQT